MQKNDGAFKPIPGSTVSIAATSTSGNVAIPAAALMATAMRMVVTTGTANVRVRSGVGSGTTAVATDMLFLNGTVEAVAINSSDTYVAAKTDSGTATIEFTFGFGQ
jgi:hypothetical protein